MRAVSLLLSLLLLLGFLLTGCADDEEPGPDDPAVVDPPPTPDLLMQAYKTCHEDMDPAQLDVLLHENFRFILQQDTVNEFDLPDNDFDRTEDLAILQNIFSGDPLTTPGGMVPGVSAISFTTFEQQAAWSTTPANDPNFPSATYATFNVRLEFARPGATYLIIQGFLQFYVAEVATTSGSGYQLLGMVDLTNGKSTENVSLGAVHALYRTPDPE